MLKLCVNLNFDASVSVIAVISVLSYSDSNDASVFSESRDASGFSKSSDASVFSDSSEASVYSKSI